MIVLGVNSPTNKIPSPIEGEQVKVGYLESRVSDFANIPSVSQVLKGVMRSAPPH